MKRELQKAELLLIWYIRCWIHKLEPDASKPTAINARIILSWITDFGSFDDDGVTVERPPGMNKIAQFCGLKRQAALYARRRLERDGMLVPYKGPERRWVVPWSVFDDRIREQYQRLSELEIEWALQKETERKKHAPDVFRKLPDS